MLVSETTSCDSVVFVEKKWNSEGFKKVNTMHIFE